MKAIFLVNEKEKIKRVYGKRNTEKIKKLVDLDEEVYSEEDILANPKKFKDVEYIFSTWSMPGGGDIKLVDYFPKLKVLFYAAGSVKYFANEYLEKGVRITSAYAANAVPVAEFTVGQILLANKGFYYSSFLAKQDKYELAHDYSEKHKGNYDAKIGIIGVGMIGRKVIELLKHYRFEILGFDDFLDEKQMRKLGAKKATLEEIFTKCHIVSNHLANVPETVGILKEEHFRMMKPNSTFINTGRGAQVDEDGFLRVMAERKDLTALLDVTVNEPPKRKEFFTLHNIFLTPHIAGSMSNEVKRMSQYMIDEFKRYLKGEDMHYEITAEKLKTMA